MDVLRLDRPIKPVASTVLIWGFKLIPQQLPHEWSGEALRNKAQLYLETMLSFPRGDWKFALWSALSLELLARAALSNISPALLADGKAHWHHLLYSLGNQPNATNYRPRAVYISEVFIRLQELIPDFTVELVGFCREHVHKRNEELHSGASPFEGVSESSWLPTYYRACQVLLNSMNQGLESFLGTDEATVASAMIEAAQDESAKSVRQAIRAHKLVWEDVDVEEKERLIIQSSTWATRQTGHRVSCPACECIAILSGTPISAPVPEIMEEEITETQEYLPTRFECLACGLKISGLSRLSSAGLGDTFNAKFTYDPGEYFGTPDYYPEDYYRDYEPDYNEP